MHFVCVCVCAFVSIPEALILLSGGGKCCGNFVMMGKADKGVAILIDSLTFNHLIGYFFNFFVCVCVCVSRSVSVLL